VLTLLLAALQALPETVPLTLLRAAPQALRQTLPLTVPLALPLAAPPALPETVPLTLLRAAPQALRQTLPLTVQPALPLAALLILLLAWLAALPGAPSAVLPAGSDHPSAPGAWRLPFRCCASPWPTRSPRGVTHPG
jgi:hypothetical protein